MPVASAQVKSAILLAALFASGATEVLEPSPSRDHTERMLREFGVEVVSNGLTVRVAGGQALRAPAGPIVIPADFSSAAFPLVAAAIVSGSDVRLPLVGANPTRTGLFDLLLEMGARVSMSGRSASAEPTATFSSRGSALRGVLVSGETVVRAIDEFPILAIAATQAQGDTVIRDAGELRVKESDRIASVAAELRKMGASIDETADGMIVHGRAQLRGAVVEAHRDHRLAMALAVAGLAADGETIVRGAEAIGDSFPSFVEDMQRLGARIHWCEGADQGAGAGGSND